MKSELSQSQLPKSIQEVLLNLVQQKGMFDCMATVQDAIYKIEGSQDSEYNQALMDVLMFILHRYIEVSFPNDEATIKALL